jgi:diguanylate cyclase (GGDEF)-like protein
VHALLLVAALTTRALANCERAGAPQKVSLCRGTALQKDGKTREAESELTSAVALAVRAADAKTEVDARGSLGFLQYDRGAMAAALANFQEAYRIATRTGDQKARLDALTLMANVYADAKVAQYDRAIEYYRQALAEYEKIGKPSDVADTLYNIGSTSEAKGDPAAAEPYYRRALALFEKIDRPGDVAYTKCSLGSSLMKQNRAQEALPLLDAALAFYERAKDAAYIAWVKQYRGSAYRRLGRAAEALDDLDAARRYYEGEKNVRYLEKNTDETALVYEQLGDWRNAYAFRTRHAALQQELAAARRDELSARLRVEFDAEKKEQENRALERENKLRFVAIILTAALAVALALLFWRQAVNTRRMRAIAMTDELTRLANRRHIMAAVEIAFAEAKRMGREVALIVFDIDRFKRINDTWGHGAGDVVLQGIARACRLVLRPNDQLGRIGGEEFLVLLAPGTTAAQAADVAERLRATVEQLDFAKVAPDLHVTISLGVWVGSASDASAAIAAVDALLYRAKENGRNRVEAAA